MKITLTTLLLTCCFCSGLKAQTKLPTDSNEFRLSHFTISAQDSESEIFSFTMTGDTSILKPIDTVYYHMDNKINREIRYRYFINKHPYYLITRSEYSNQNWLLFSIQFALYKKD